MTIDDAEKLALRCVREQVPVMELIRALAKLRGADIAVVTFGPCRERIEARNHLKAAETAARL